MVKFLGGFGHHNSVKTCEVNSEHGAFLDALLYRVGILTGRFEPTCLLQPTSEVMSGLDMDVVCL